MRKSKENGITLIALIITIIVMLILVGVTVSVALNGGLFKTASDAAKGTQYELDYETLQAGIVGALDKKELKILTAQSLRSNLPSEWDVSGVDGGPYTVTSIKGNEFKVLSDGTIKEISTGTLALLEKYFFEENGEGKSLQDIFNGETFIDDPESITNASSTLKIIGSTAMDNMMIKYKENNEEKVYLLTYNIDTVKVNNIELVYEKKRKRRRKSAV